MIPVLDNIRGVTLIYINVHALFVHTISRKCAEECYWKLHSELRKKKKVSFSTSYTLQIFLERYWVTCESKVVVGWWKVLPNR